MDWSKSVCESPKWLIPTVVICSWFCWLMVHCLLLTPSFTLAACWIIEPWYHCFRRNPCYPRWRHCHQSAPQFWLCTCGTGWTYRLFKEQTRIILGDLVQVNLQNRGTPVTTMGCTISLCLCFFWQNNHDFFLTCRGSCIVPLWSLLLRGFVLHLLLANCPFLLDSSGIYPIFRHIQVSFLLVALPFFSTFPAGSSSPPNQIKGCPFPRDSPVIWLVIWFTSETKYTSELPIQLDMFGKKTLKKKQTLFKKLPWKTNYVKPMEKNTNIFQHTKDQASSEVSREHFTISLA